MTRIWLQHYPPGVPADIDPRAFASLPEMIERLAVEFTDRPACHNLGHTLTYAELERLSRHFASFLQRLPGLARGDRVAIMAPNLLQYPVALFGILRAGLVVVNVNPLYTARELAHQLGDAGAKAIVVVENYASVVEEVVGTTPLEHVITTQVGDLLPAPRRWLVNLVVKRVKKMVPHWRIPGAVSFRDALARGAAQPLSPVPVAPEDLAFLQYTGGTTGVSKGAMLTHENVIANIEQTGTWIAAGLERGREIAIAPLPMYHIFCLTSTLSFMRQGSLIVLITNPRDLPAVVAELGRWKFSLMTGVNTLFNGLLRTPGFDRLDFSALKIVVGGGAAVQEAVAARWLEVTGRHILEAYGLTEASPGVSANRAGDAWDGSVGFPLPSTDVSIRGDAFEERPVRADAGDLAEASGEICVRGPQVMRGYWNNPAETASTIEHGWLRTGDVGFMDATGRVTITDRKKDLILVSGFNVYPSEVEAVIASHPGVLECGVVGVPDERSGEAVKAVVVAGDPSLTPDDVIAHCRTHLTAYKVPRRVELRDALPKTPVGKVLRRALRDPPTSG